MQILPVKVPEESSCKVSVSFRDPADESEITPDSDVLWTLTDLDGTVINSREQEVVGAAADVEFFLSGDDLAIQDQTNKLEQRIVTIETTYDPGSGSIKLKDSGQFVVVNLAYVT